MGNKKFRSCCGVLVRGVELADLLSRACVHPEPGDLHVGFTFAVSKQCGEWMMLAVHNDVGRSHFLSYVLQAFMADEGAPALLPSLPVGDVIVVSFRPDSDKSYYLLAKATGDPNRVVLRGRRDDGKGLTVHPVWGTVKRSLEARDLHLSTRDYLAARGVPADLRPGALGFAFVPAARIDQLHPLE